MINIDLQNFANVQQQLALAQLTPAKRRKLLVAVAKEALKDNKQRVKEQTKVTGSMFKPRSPKQVAKNKKLGRKKMLTGLGKRLEFKNVTDNSVMMGWKNGLMGYIAATQQAGKREVKNKSSLQSSPGNRNLSDHASSRQAAELVRLGYKVRRASGNGFKSVSKNWIKQNLTVGQAGAILRSMRGAAPSSWDIVLPARPAFGFADRDVQKYINIALGVITPAGTTP